MLNFFESREQIIELINRADNASETKRLVQKFEKLKINRDEFFINSSELEEILIWKLRSQIRRQLKLRKQNTNENIIKITKAAFSVNHQDEDLEIKMKLNLLKTIFGVQTPVASAILTLCYPNSFSVIDFRNWRQVFKTNSTKTNYSDTEYLGYLKIIRRTASDFGLSPQEIDIALWQRDIENI